ncbi:MAG: hypothetical protein HY080_14260 [Gammaproteobacteria bacterium]|nr:hypothetical protein [Gammaproteobacteria bacterium]
MLSHKERKAGGWEEIQKYTHKGRVEFVDAEQALIEVESVDLGKFQGSILDSQGNSISPYAISVKGTTISGKFILPFDTLLHLITGPGVTSKTDLFLRGGIFNSTVDDSPYHQFQSNSGSFVSGLGVDYKFNKSLLLQFEYATYMFILKVKYDSPRNLRIYRVPLRPLQLLG